MCKEKTLQKLNHTYTVDVNNKQCYFLYTISFLIYSFIFLGCQDAGYNEQTEPLFVLSKAERTFSENNSYLEFQEMRKELSNLAENMGYLPETTEQTICDRLTSFSNEILSNFQEFLGKSDLTCSLDLLARIDHFWQFNKDALNQGQRLSAQNNCVDQNGHFRMKSVSVRPGSYIDGRNLPYGHLALTFDDGPQGHLTSRLLDILDARSAKATFFMIGRSVERLPSVAWQVGSRGHSIGSHSYQHKRLSRMSTRNALNDVFRGHNTLMQKLSNSRAIKPFFRFPFGDSNSNLKNTVLRNGLSVFSWSIDARDWAETNPNRLAENTWRQIRQANYRGILLSHELEQTIRIMPWLLTTLANAGFCLVLLH